MKKLPKNSFSTEGDAPEGLNVIEKCGRRKFTVTLWCVICLNPYKNQSWMCDLGLRLTVNDNYGPFQSHMMKAGMGMKSVAPIDAGDAR